MKKLLLSGIGALFLATGTAHAQTHNADFPVQMAAINNCYVAYLVRKGPHTPPLDNNDLIACMELQNFRFCNDCQIFRYSGGSCRDDKENGPHRATCWRTTTERQVTDMDRHKRWQQFLAKQPRGPCWPDEDEQQVDCKPRQIPFPYFQPK
jgi:hypothetical protein